MALPTDAKDRKDTPIFSGVIRYFPDALAEVARVSKAGNDQHNPGEPLHWAKEKSRDELDALQRHLMEAGSLDSDGVRHSAKVAWRALANLQREIEREQGWDYNPLTDKWERQPKSMIVATEVEPPAPRRVLGFDIVMASRKEGETLDEAYARLRRENEEIGRRNAALRLGTRSTPDEAGR